MSALHNTKGDVTRGNFKKTTRNSAILKVSMKTFRATLPQHKTSCYRKMTMANSDTSFCSILHYR